MANKPTPTTVDEPTWLYHEDGRSLLLQPGDTAPTEDGWGDAPSDKYLGNAGNL